ncbi:hypothetical protein [Spirosoma sp. KNUC1025]|uniref:hypothetical protein n=1 Tax=Spirosoma sp. KNUC1025 TaxID=2894082 RepID=UPI0038706012|nr:DUF863 family protein [Spirosoma sp. KNUC1025]
MDELEKNIPDDFWRKAFDEAAETPPSRVWDSVERRLDESDGTKIIPLWGIGPASSRPVVWWSTGVAAALTLLFVGWWAFSNESTPISVARVQPSVAQPKLSSPSESIALAPATSPAVHHSLNASVNEKNAATSNNKPVHIEEPSLAANSSTPELGNRSKKEASEQILTQMARDVNVLSHRTNPAIASPALHSAPSRTATDALAHTRGQIANTSFTPGSYTGRTAIASSQVAAAYELLNGRPLRLRSPGQIQRIVWFQPAELPLEAEMTKEKHKAKEKWASVSVMPGAFNPSVSVKNSPIAAFSNARTSQSAVNSRASFSIAYQAGAGIQLSDRWSVESGIGYLAGHSSVDASAQSASMAFLAGSSSDKSAVVNNVYVDALRNSVSNRSVQNVSPSNSDLLNNGYLSQGTYSNQTIQTLANDYQYMQVPVQVGYQLRPRKRLSLAVLGGLVTNIFVRNTVGSDLIITAKDGVYRPVSLAATMGARFRYRPSGRWSASLAGQYQPSLELGTQADSQVQTRPTSTGMSFGLDYHF